MADSKEKEDNIKAIQNSEELLNLSNSILNSYNERAKVLRGLSAEEATYRYTINQQQKLSQQITANAEKYIGYQIKSKDLAKQIAATESNRSKSQDAFRKIQGDVTKQYQASLKANTQLLEKIEKENKLNLQANNLIDLAKNRFQELIRSREKGENVSLRTLATARINLRNAQEEVRVSDKLLKNLNTQQQEQDSIAKTSGNLLADGVKSQESQNKELAFLRENLRIRKDVEKSTGLLGAISKSVAKIPGIGQYLNADEAIDEMEKLAASMAERNEDATSFGNRLKIASKGVSTLAKGFYENIKSPEAIFTFFISAAMTANKESVNLSKNLGYGAANADRVRANFVDIEGSANNLNVTTANLSEAFNELSTSTGFVTEYSADALTTQIKLTKQLGLSGDEAAGVYKFSVLTGKSSEQTYQSMLKGYVATRNSLNVGVPFKAAMAEAAKVSGQLASNLGNNPETIIKAVVATKALGTSLEQAKQQGESLLDFQSSIENELKAELITGQQLNLERARAAALMGDQVTVAEELAAQGMTAAKFSGMNVIAQKSFAEALGTTSDELANQLAKREMAIASGKSLAQITAEEADEAAERQDIQEKFNAAMLKLQSVIGNLVAGPLGSFLELLSGALNIINYMAVPLKMIGILFLGIRGTQMAINAAKKISLGYDIASKAANQISANLGLAQIGTNRAKNLLEKESLLTKIAGNIQLFYQLASEQGIGNALKIQFGFQQANTVLKERGLLLTMKDFIFEKGKLLFSYLQKTGLVAINALKLAGAAIERRTAIVSIASAAMGAFKAAVSGIGAALGPLAIPIGIAAAAGVAALGYSFLQGDDVISEGGYGNRTLLSPEGAIRLNNKDTVIAGTNLGGDKINSVRSSPAMDISPMISAINQVTAAVTTLNNKSWDVKLDSKSVGSGLMQNSYKSA